MSKSKMSSTEEELNCFLSIFEFMGLQYFSAKSLSEKSLKEKPSFWRVIHLLVLFLLISSIMISYIIQFNPSRETNVTYKNVLTLVIQYSMNVGMLLIVWVGLFDSFRSVKSMKKILLNVKEIRKLSLLDFRIEIDFKRIRERTWRRFASIIAFVAIVHGTFSFWHLETQGVYKALFGVIPMSFVSVIVYKQLFLIDMVNNQLEYLQRLLESVFHYKPIRIIDNINFHLTTVKSAEAPEDPMKKLRATWKLYNIIYNSSNLVNDSLGLTALILLVSMVIALTGSGYEVFVIVMGKLPSSRIPGEQPQHQD